MAEQPTSTESSTTEPAGTAPAPDADPRTAADTAADVPWWRRGVVYQVYPRSFADANGDGTGDVNGIRSKLGYLRNLGVNAIWISPWYPSPLLDGGYDVRDFRDIDPRFGTLADAEALISEAHDHDIKIIVDLVPNHTSWEHEWFKAALAAGPGSPERNRYIFRDGRGPDGSEPPTNWLSVFGGPAWTRVEDGQWYLHIFDTSQPDLNWTLEEVRAEYDDIFRFWLDRGVDGFRIDVAHGMCKDMAFPDIDGKTEVLSASDTPNHPHWDRDEVHEIIRRWRAVLDASGRDVMMVAEAWVHPESLPKYLRPGEYHQSFNFDFLTAEWDVEEYRAAIDRAIAAARSVGSTPTWTLANHDVMRHASRFGLPKGTNWRTWPVTGPAEALDPELGLRRARAAALVLMALPGSLYVYQGEELGLPEAWDLPDDVLDDPVAFKSGGTQKGRDGCRVPIPWSGSPAEGTSFGFGANGAWLPQPPVFGELAADTQVGVDGSTFELYRQALALRDELGTGDESFAWVEVSDGALAFGRDAGLTCIVNFGPDPITLPDGEVLISSEPIDGELPADTAAWIRTT